MAQVLKDIPTQLWRTALLYLVAFVVFRVMGKRSIGHLAPFDVAVIIMIGEAVAIGIEEPTKPILMAIIPIAFLGLLQLGLTWINMKWWKVEDITQGTDTVLVKDGKLIMKNLWKERISQADVLTSLRQKGVTKVKDVKEARLEPTGYVSVIKMDEVSPMTPQTVGIKGNETLEDIIKKEISGLREEIRKIGSRAKPALSKGR